MLLVLLLVVVPLLLLPVAVQPPWVWMATASPVASLRMTEPELPPQVPPELWLAALHTPGFITAINEAVGCFERARRGLWLGQGQHGERRGKQHHNLTLACTHTRPATPPTLAMSCQVQVLVCPKRASSLAA